MDDSFRIKKKKTEIYPKQRTSLENSADEVEHFTRKTNTAKRFALPEINTDKIFEEILEEASRDNTVYTTVHSIINMARRELVT